MRGDVTLLLPPSLEKTFFYAILYKKGKMMRNGNDESADCR